MSTLPNRIQPAAGIFFIFSFLFLSSCIFPPSEQFYNDFILVKVKNKDSLSSLAARYLNDPSKGWVIAEFNDIKAVYPRQQIIIPLRPFKLGGLRPDGYQTVPILAYHRFTKKNPTKMITTETAFENQLKFLKENNYNTITLEQLSDFLDFSGQIPEKSVVITLDDGWLSNIEIALPILKKYGFTATLFVYTDFIGGKKALTWKQIKELSNNGFDIQCHTKTHRNLVKLKKGESFKDYLSSLNREISLSKQIIRQNLNKECKYFAYPYGATNHLIIAFLKKDNYHGAFTVNRGGNPFFIDKFMINRSVIYGDYNLKDFEKNLTTFKKIKLK